MECKAKHVQCQTDRAEGRLLFVTSMELLGHHQRRESPMMVHTKPIPMDSSSEPEMDRGSKLEEDNQHALWMSRLRNFLTSL